MVRQRVTLPALRRAARRTPARVVVRAQARRRRSPSRGRRSRSGSSAARKWSNAATWPARSTLRRAKPRSSGRRCGRCVRSRARVVAHPADDARRGTAADASSSGTRYRGKQRVERAERALVVRERRRAPRPSTGDRGTAHESVSDRVPAEEREAAPAFGVLDRLEQEALALADELGECRQRRLEVGEHLAPHRARRCSSRRARRTCLDQAPVERLRLAPAASRRGREWRPVAEGPEEAAAATRVAGAACHPAPPRTATRPCRSRSAARARTAGRPTSRLCTSTPGGCGSRTSCARSRACARARPGFIHPTMSTSLVPSSCTITGTRPLAS